MTEKPLKIFNASAGSGKTYTLVQEYLRIVLHSDNPLKFRSVLAMTFTNKAANEMKERILDGLIHLGKPEHDKNQDELEFLINTAKNLGLGPRIIEERSAKILNRILHNYSSFSVMTIDKFTYKVIRTFAKDLGISIDFDVELDLKKLRKNVTDLLFDQIGRDPDLTNLMLRYANTNLSEDKSWNFSQQLYDFSNEIFKEEAIRAIALLKKLSAQDFLNIQNELIKENSKIEQQLKGNAQEAIDLIQSKQLEAADFQGKSNSIVGYFKRVASGKYVPGSATLQRYIEEDKWGHPSSPNKGDADAIAPLLNQYYNQIQFALEGDYQTFLINREILKNLNNLSLLNHLLRITEQVKADENILLISDFYKKIAEIITEEPVPFIYERLGVRYSHFLLDEFQDTSHLQWINLIPLVHNALASKQTNLIVGDGKQAIYRWRNGEVEQFTNLPDHIFNPENIASLKEAEPLFKALGAKYPLTKNFRSAPEIVQFNNALFTSLTQNLPDQLQNIYEDLVQEPVKKMQGYVESKIIPDFSKEDQLAYVLETVNRSIANNYELKDICILTRNNTEGANIARFLTERGIKVISPDSLFIGKDLAVKFIVNLMGALTHQGNKNFKIKTLEHFANLVLKEGVRSVMEKHNEAIATQEITTILKQYDYQLLPPAAFHNLYEFTDALMTTFNLRVAENPFLQFLLEQTHLFEKRNNSSARDFVKWFQEKGHQTSIVSPDGANAIQVMTIHKSKGLQFPVVICPYTDWDMDINREISWVEDENGKLPAYFVKISRNLENTVLSDTYEKEYGKFLLDHLNLLYVAFTRPERALFISGNAGKRKKSPAKEWLYDFFQSTELGSLADDCFTFGDFVPKPASSFKMPENFNAAFYGKRMNKPVLSFKSAENWDIDELDEKRLFGNKVHGILGELNDPDALEETLNLALRKGRIEAEEKASIRKFIDQLFTDEHFKSYFSGTTQFNEKELITADGKKLIPDKIIESNGHLKVIDFKTGQESFDHKKQVFNYIKILKAMGYDQVSGEIYYTENQHIVPVGEDTVNLTLFD